MKLLTLLKSDADSQTVKDNPSVKCNALSKTDKSLNIQLTPGQAIEFARHLLQKAQLLIDRDVEDGTVQVWCVGVDSEAVSFGLMPARKGPRRKKAAKASRQ